VQAPESVCKNSFFILDQQASFDAKKIVGEFTFSDWVGNRFPIFVEAIFAI